MYIETKTDIEKLVSGMQRMIKNIKWILEASRNKACEQNVQNDKKIKWILEASRNKACEQNVQNDKKIK